MSDRAPEACQALVLSGHGKLPYSAVEWWWLPEGAPVLPARSALREISTKIEFGIPKPDRAQAWHLAFSAKGLVRLGVEADAIRACGRPFATGMTTPRRQRALGDLGENAPERWAWSDERSHLLVLIYARTEALRAEILARLHEIRERGGFEQAASLTTYLPGDGREPFGFKDALTNVRPRLGEGGPSTPGTDEVAPGEVVLGMRDALDVEVSFGWLGDLGTFLVARQLEQDVEAFWQFWRRQGESDTEAVWLASKAMGRWPNGMPIAGSRPVPEPEADDATIFGALDFLSDRFGDDCPIGAHVRRAHPRDGLFPDDPERSLRASAAHRMVRRGRRYGPAVGQGQWPFLLEGEETALEDSGASSERGLFFVALVGDIARQFEFVQQTWLNNPRFAQLSQGADPIAPGREIRGDEGVFVRPERPVRDRIQGLVPWVRVRGGGYFLLPSRPALTRLLSVKE